MLSVYKLYVMRLNYLPEVSVFFSLIDHIFSDIRSGVKWNCYNDCTEVLPLGLI